eukprot:gene111-146_t
MSNATDDEKAIANGEKVWDAPLEKIMKQVMGKKGIRTKFAGEVGKKKVEYFRGRDFTTWVLANADSIALGKGKKVLEEYLKGELPSSDEDVCKIGAALMAKGFVTKAIYKPMHESKDSEKKPKKWPDRIVKLAGADFDPDGFYMIRWEGSTTWRNVQIAGMIIVCVAISGWTAWPFWLKVAIWYCLLGLITAYLMLEFTRCSSFTALWVVGFDFWIFPNLNDECLGFFEIWKPLYSIEKRADTKTGFMIRFAVLGIGAIAVDQIAKHHSLSDFTDFMTENYSGLLDWGKEYMRPQLMGGKREVPSIAQFEAEEQAEREEEERRARMEARGQTVEDSGSSGKAGKKSGGAASSANTGREASREASDDDFAADVDADGDVDVEEVN